MYRFLVNKDKLVYDVKEIKFQRHDDTNICMLYLPKRASKKIHPLLDQFL